MAKDGICDGSKRVLRHLVLISMALNLNILDLYCIPWVAVIAISHFAFGQSATITTHVARAVPFSHKSLTGTPILTYTGVSKLRCIVECTRTNCSSFNIGADTCELLQTYLCEETETLVTRTNFKHYDVEFGIWLQVRILNCFIV